MTFDPLPQPAGPEEDPVQHTTGPRTVGRAPEPSPLEEWHRAHAALLAKERAFLHLVGRCAKGVVSRREVELAHQELRAIRALADAVLQKALDLRCSPSST